MSAANNVTVSVPRSRVVQTNAKDDKLFFGVLQTTSTLGTLQAEIKKTFRRPTLFQDMLATYIQVVSDKVESLAPNLSDREHIKFVDWVLLQGRDTVQALVDATDLSDARWRTEDGKLRGAVGHWYIAA